MRRLTVAALCAAMLCWQSLPAFSYTLQYENTSATAPFRWASTTINIELSDSLLSAPNITSGGQAASQSPAVGAQVIGAARRALRRWSDVSNIDFVVTVSTRQSVSPSGGADGANLITVANTPANAALTGCDPVPGAQTGATRIFRNHPTEAHVITEADIAISHCAEFSLDGEAGTYDFESVVVHEVGHLLGLGHSGVIGATMMAQQVQANQGAPLLPVQTPRTLADDDIAGVRALYGPTTGLGTITGTVTTSGVAVFGAHVWAEDVVTGRVMGGNVTLNAPANTPNGPPGRYTISGLPPGTYRIIAEHLDGPVAIANIANFSRGYTGSTTQPAFRTTEVGQFSLAAGQTRTVDFSVVGGANTYNPTGLGTTNPVAYSFPFPVPLVPGRTTTVVVGGNNMHANAPFTVSAQSPFITIGSVTTTSAQGIEAISFDVTLDLATPPGEYSLRLQSARDEVTYLAGGLLVDLPSGVLTGNPIDETRFFVAQHYRDFLFREGDAGGMQFWINDIDNACQPINDPQQRAFCFENKRNNVSAAFFLSIEFQETGYLVYRFYRASFPPSASRPNGFPRYKEFIRDTQTVGRNVIVGTPGWPEQLEANKEAFALAWVQRADFVAEYPTTMSAEAYVNKLFQTAGVTPTDAERQAAINSYNAGTTMISQRERGLRSVVESQSFRNQEFNRAFVLMQYFGYLRRNPNDYPDADFAGYDFWLKKLNDHHGNFLESQMVLSFLLSGEYRARFGR